MFAVRHPGKVRSLVSIMSTTGARRVGRAALKVLPFVLKARGGPTRGSRRADGPRRRRRRPGRAGRSRELIRGMGHDLPRGAWEQIVGLIAMHARSADGRRLAPSAVESPGSRG